MPSELEIANTLHRAGQFPEAEQAFSAILTNNPHSAFALMRLGELALAKNQVSQAKHYLHQALEKTSWLEKLTMGIQIKSLLAMSYYREDHFPQAAHYFNEASRAIPLLPMNDLKALGTHLAHFGDDPPYRIEGASSTRIPFVITDPLPVVKARVNDHEMLFLLDTGGAELILDTETAQSLGVEFVASLSGAGGGSKGKIQLGKLDRFQLGDMLIHNVPIHSLDTSHIAASFDHLPIKGIIGTRLFMHFLTTIDYPNACLSLQPPTTQVQSQKTIPFYLVQSHYMLAQGSLNDSEPMLLFIDTGLGGQGFSLDEGTAQKLGINPDWSQAEMGVAGFGDTLTTEISANCLSLGQGDDQIIARDLKGIIFKKPSEILGYRLGFYIGAVVSHAFFRNYALTFDYLGMRLLIDER